MPNSSPLPVLSRDKLIALARERALTELARREYARDHFIAFVEYNKPDYVAAGVHHRIGAKLEEIERGDCKRLMVFISPSTGKSELVSRKFPAYVLGRQPTAGYISATYGSDLATKFGREVRNTVDSRLYRNLFPGVELSPDSQAKDEWHTTQGGSYTAVGVGGGLTGFHGNYLSIDDPVKDRAQAESVVFRDSVWDWYRSVLFTRRKDPLQSAIILCCTRWHEDDLAGRLLEAEANGTGDKWDKISVPALNPNGTSFYPEKFPVTELARIRAVVGEYDWASLYDQRPRPAGGSFFTEASLLVDGKPVDVPQHVDTVFAVLDTALKTGRANDGVGVVFYARTRSHGVPLAIMDWDLKQIEGALLETWLPTIFTRLEELARLTKARLGVAGAWIEDKGSGTVLLQQAQKPAFVDRGWEAHPIDSPLTAMGKAERAINVSGYVHQGQVKMTAEAYNRVVTYKGRTRNHLLSQVLAFRAGTKDQGEDDLLDGFSYGIALGLGGSEGF